MNRRLFGVGLSVLVLAVLATAAWLVWRVDPSTGVENVAVATPTLEPPSLAQVRVIIQDAETQAPLAGADVQIGQRQGKTDAGGTCTLAVKNNATHTVQIRADRYLDWQKPLAVALTFTDTLTVQAAMEPNQVTGQVLGDGNRPLAGAVLTWAAQLVPLDAEGKFTLRRVAMGDVLSVAHPGYEPLQVTYDGTSLKFSLKPVVVTVSVFDALTGQAVPEAAVCAGGAACASTDAAGQVAVRAVANGTALSIRRTGYLSTTLNYAGTRALAVELAPRELHGMVRDAATGRPLTDTLLFANGQVVSLDKQGRYHLPDLTQVYTLFVKAPGYKRVTVPIGAETTTRRYGALDACRDPGDLPCVDIVLTRFPVRGLYANYGLLVWDKKRLLELIDLVDRSPLLNAIVLDIKSDQGYVAFESDDPIIASGNAMATPRLPLPEFLRLCKERHIYTIARMVVFKDNELIKARPELAVRHPNGAIFYDREGMAWSDPTRQAVWEYNIAITREAIRMGFDEIQYDYLRYPSDSTSLAVVRALVYSVPSTLESRTGAIAGFLEAAKAAVDPTPAFLSADLFGSALSLPPEQDMRIGQRLMDMAPHADYVCPMIYPSTFIPGNLGLPSPSDEPYKVIALSMKYGHARTDTLIRPWLQHYWYDRYEIAEQRRAAEEATDIGWCYWNAGAKYDELFFVPPEGLNP